MWDPRIKAAEGHGTAHTRAGSEPNASISQSCSSPDALPLFAFVTSSATNEDDLVSRFAREDWEVVRKVGITLKRLNIEERVFTVSYRLGLFPLLDPESRVFVDLVYGHEWSDPVLDMVGEGALVTGHSVHVLMNPATSQKVEISDEWRTKLQPLTPLPLL